MIVEFQKNNQIYQITGSILDYAMSLPVGVHYAIVMTADNVEGADAPELGRGFVYEIHKFSSSVIHLYATQFQSDAPRRYCRKRYSSAWGNWLEM